VADSLGTAIVTGVYTAGNPMPIEAELCQQYGASRSVVREAVKMLTAKVCWDPGRGWARGCSRKRIGICSTPTCSGGSWSRKFSAPLLIEFTELRLAVEPGAAVLAARVAGPDEKAAIRNAIERMQAAERGDGDPAGARYRLSCSRAAREPQSILCATHRIYRNCTAYQHPHDESIQGCAARERRRSQEGRGRHHRRTTAAAGEAMRKLIQEALDLITKREALQVARRSRQRQPVVSWEKSRSQSSVWARSPGPTHSFPSIEAMHSS